MDWTRKVNPVTSTDGSSSSRSLAQVFLGVSSSAFEDSGGDQTNTALETSLRKMLSDLSLWIYRNASGSLLFAAGQDIARQTFAHETAPALRTLRNWAVPLTDYFIPIQLGANKGWQIRPEKLFLDETDIGVVPFLSKHQAAISRMSPWLMADNVSDLPFYDDTKDDAGLPLSFSLLAESCFREAWKNYSFSVYSILMGQHGRIHGILGDLQKVQTFLDSNSPTVRVKSIGGDMPVLNWGDINFRPKLNDFSRLLLVCFREAFQHGSWNSGVDVHFNYKPESGWLHLAMRNKILTDEDILNEARSFPAKLVTATKEIFVDGRTKMHSHGGTLKSVKSGQTQSDFITESAGGHLNHSNVDPGDQSIWLVEASFKLSK